MHKKSAKSKQKGSNKKQEKSNQKKQKKQEEEDQKSEQKFSLYKLLQLEQGAKSSIDQIKKQYRKLVMVYHPDKNIGDQTAKQKFHKLKQAYDILIDPEKKKIYDQTGTIDGQFDQNSFQTAYQYYRRLYKKIQKQDIDDFETKYRNGQMEKEDLLQFYQKNSGNMITLLQSIPLSKNQDIPRFIKFFEEKIEQKVIKKFKKFDQTKGKVRQLKDQSQQFEKIKEAQEKSMKQLSLAIRNKSNKSFLDSLQQKYGAKKQKISEDKTEKQGRKRVKKQ